jgi:hypothetical protein
MSGVMMAPVFIIIATLTVTTTPLYIGYALLLYLVGFLTICVGLALNRRHIFTTLYWLGIICFALYLMSIREVFPALQKYTLLRNIFLINIALYIPAHLIIHTIAYFITRKRKIITKRGLLEGALALAIVLFLYIITFLIKDCINIFYYWYYI